MIQTQLSACEILSSLHGGKLLVAWRLWLLGFDIADCHLFGVSIRWLGRIGKILQFIGAITICLEIIGYRNIRNFSEKRTSVFRHWIAEQISKQLDSPPFRVPAYLDFPHVGPPVVRTIAAVMLVPMTFLNIIFVISYLPEIYENFFRFVLESFGRVIFYFLFAIMFLVVPLALAYIITIVFVVFVACAIFVLLKVFGLKRLRRLVQIGAVLALVVGSALDMAAS